MVVAFATKHVGREIESDQVVVFRNKSINLLNNWQIQ
jgi:hypothetical protein